MTSRSGRPGKGASIFPVTDNLSPWGCTSVRLSVCPPGQPYTASKILTTGDFVKLDRYSLPGYRGKYMDGILEVVLKAFNTSHYFLTISYIL